MTLSPPWLTSSQNLSWFFIIYFPSPAWGTISHFHCSAVGMWELLWERSAVSRWPFCADSDIAEWWEGSIVRVTPPPTLHRWDQICSFIQVKCQPFWDLRIVWVAQKKVTLPPDWNRQRPKTFGTLISLSKTHCQAFPSVESERCVMLRLTSRPNRLMVRYVHIVTLEKGPSEWTKAEQPGGTKLSLPVSL